ncbi:hypothetical protein BU16DRAFT_541073 [Lophium mytilinum]|uniref:RNase H type-1 domain-containing protein n=1 Tax=Lophium mytilinum TaxID=390894 RepID=A0A6A6QMM4_9PEZI|nr:hypothetical protein BU16DRAFT_541073 [Lophium mytilinum]
MDQIATRTEDLLDTWPHLREPQHAAKKSINPVGALCCIFEAGADKQAIKIDYFLDVLAIIGRESPLWSEVQEEKLERGMTDRRFITAGSTLDEFRCALKAVQRGKPILDEHQKENAELLESLRATRKHQRREERDTHLHPPPSSPRQPKRTNQELWHSLLSEGDVENGHSLRNSETFKNGLARSVFIDKDAMVAKRNAVIGKNVFWTDASTRVNGLSAVAVAYHPVNSPYLSTSPANAGYGHCSDSAETFGILYALDVAEHLLRWDNEWREAMVSDMIVIQCDSQNALRQIGACTANKGSCMRSYIKRIVERVYRIYELGIKVEFRWVPGHKGVLGNLCADRAAKAARMQYEHDAGADRKNLHCAYLETQYAHNQSQLEDLRARFSHLRDAAEAASVVSAVFEQAATESYVSHTYDWSWTVSMLPRFWVRIFAFILPRFALDQKRRIKKVLCSVERGTWIGNLRRGIENISRISKKAGKLIVASRSSSARSTANLPSPKMLIIIACYQSLPPMTFVPAMPVNRDPFLSHAHPERAIGD